MDNQVQVLHVDDEPDFTDLTATFLERANEQFTVETASSASQGLDRLANADFDCIVSDYDMPGQNGLEFLNTVRADAPDLPFILFTGKGSEQLASEAIAAGITDYLQKESGTQQYTLLANRIKNAVAQYRAEQAVEKTEQRYRRLIEESTDVITVIDGDGTFQYLSPAAERLLGYTPQELVDEDAFEYIHPDDREVVMERFADQVGHPERRVTAEFRFAHANGSWTWLEVRGRNLLDDFIIDGIVVYARDVTERKERERDLQQSQELIEALSTSFSEYTFVLNDAGEYLDAVTGWQRTRLYTPDELIGQTIDDILANNLANQLHDAIRTALDTNDLQNIEYSIEKSEGTSLYEANVAPLPNGYKGDPAVVLSAYDITKHKEREQKLQRERDRLNEFASIVSHDIRNPLNVAEGRVDLAQEECDSEHLETAADALDRIETLITDLLVLARDGARVRELEAVDLAEAVDRCWQTTATADATLSIETEHTIQADSSRLRQLLANLIQNAVDHGGEDVTITVGDLDDGSGFYIADDGPGIPESEDEQIFDLGYTTNEDGTGFGLSIVREIVEAHDWDISVTDSDHGETRFEITGI